MKIMSAIRERQDLLESIPDYEILKYDQEGDTYEVVVTHKELSQAEAINLAVTLSSSNDVIYAIRQSTVTHIILPPPKGKATVETVPAR